MSEKSYLKDWWADDEDLVYAARQRSCFPEYEDNIEIAKREIMHLRVLLEIQLRENAELQKLLDSKGES